MGNYREYNSKKTCLLAALSSSAVLAVDIFLTAQVWTQTKPEHRLLCLLCLAVILAASLSWWRRWFAYDKKK